MKWQARGGKFNITRRSLLKGFAASAVVAIAASFPGTVNAAPLQVQEIMMADRDMICIEVRDSSISQFPMVESTPPAGATVTDIQTNPSGGFRLSLSTATATTYARMLAIHGVTNVGGLVCLEFGAGLLTGMGITTGASMMVNNMTGAHDIENTWTVTVTDSTHVTLNGSSYATLGASGYTNGGYVGGGWSGGTSILANTRMHIRGVAGTLGDELNAQWFWGAVWDSSTLDIANFWAWNAKYGFGSAATYNTWGVPQKANVYTSGGTVSVGGFMTATNPFNGTPAGPPFASAATTISSVSITTLPISTTWIALQLTTWPIGPRSAASSSRPCIASRCRISSKQTCSGGSVSSDTIYS